MRIRSVADLGAFIKEQRLSLGMEQATLAKAAGTSRKWLVEMEGGKARAEIGLILKTLKALGVAMEFNPAPPSASRTKVSTPTDLDALLNSLKKRP